MTFDPNEDITIRMALAALDPESVEPGIWKRCCARRLRLSRF
jgi:hypothetical protein